MTATTGPGIGIAINKDDNGKPYMYLVVQHEGVSISVYLTDAEHADYAVNELVRGLKQVKADLKREASGLLIADVGVIPNGLRKPQGG
jgi:hypothetical protein